MYQLKFIIISLPDFITGRGKKLFPRHVSPNGLS